MTIAMDYRKQPAAGIKSKSKSKLRLRMIAAGAVVLVGIGVAGAMQFGGSSRAIPQPNARITTVLKDINLSASVMPTNARGVTDEGFDWYVCSLTTSECDHVINALRAKSDGSFVKTLKRVGAIEDAPRWWTPQSAGDVQAFEIDSPEFWVGVSEKEGKMFVRRARH